MGQTGQTDATQGHIQTTVDSSAKQMLEPLGGGLLGMGESTTEYDSNVFEDLRSQVRSLKVQNQEL